MGQIALAKRISLEFFEQWETHMRNTTHRYDDLLAARTREDLVGWLAQAHSYIYSLGEGGMITFFPIIPGRQAQVHIDIWDPQWMRRDDLYKSVCVDAMKRWDLHRVVATIPEDNVKACSLAERLGMVPEGVLREELRYTVNDTEKVGNVKVYSFLRGEVV